MVAQAFQPAGLGDLPVAPKRNWKVPPPADRNVCSTKSPRQKSQVAWAGGLNGSGGSRKSLQLNQCRLDGVEVRQVLGHNFQQPF